MNFFRYFVVSICFLFLFACASKDFQLPPQKTYPKGTVNSKKEYSILKVTTYDLKDTERYRSLALDFLEDHSKFSDQEIQTILSILLNNSAKYKINPLYVLSLAKATSGLKQDYRTKDRIGFVPLTEAKARYVAGAYKIKFSKFEELLSYDRSLEIAFAYFAYLAKIYPGNYERYTIAYSWNAESLKSFLRGTAPLAIEHQNLLDKVTKAYLRITDADLVDIEPVSENVKQEQPVAKKEASSAKAVDSEKRQEMIVTEENSDQAASDTEGLAENPDQESESVETKQSKLPKYYTATSYALADLQKLALQTDLGVKDDASILALVINQSKEAGIDPLFVLSFIRNSSNFDSTQVVNSKYGLMQISIEDATLAAKTKKLTPPTEASLLDPETNLRLSLAYLKITHDIFSNNSFQALAGYRWGIKNLIAALKNQTPLPPLVKAYPEKIISSYQQYEELIATPLTSSVTEVQGSTAVSSEIEKIICKDQTKDCVQIAKLIKGESAAQQVDPILIALFAKLQSDIKADLKSNGRVGLFQWDAQQAEKICEYVKVAWGGENALLDPEYSVKLAVRYQSYLQKRFRANREYQAIALFWDADQLTNSILEKTPVPNEVNSKASQFISLTK